MSRKAVLLGLVFWVFSLSSCENFGYDGNYINATYVENIN